VGPRFLPDPPRHARTVLTGADVDRCAQRAFSRRPRVLLLLPGVAVPRIPRAPEHPVGRTQTRTPQRRPILGRVGGPMHPRENAGARAGAAQHEDPCASGFQTMSEDSGSEPAEDRSCKRWARAGRGLARADANRSGASSTRSSLGRVPDAVNGAGRARSERNRARGSVRRGARTRGPRTGMSLAIWCSRLEAQRLRPGRVPRPLEEVAPGTR